MSLHYLFSPFSVLHVSFSFSLFFFCFVFFKQLVFFSDLSSFHFSFFNMLFDLFFFSFIEIINFYWFLFKSQGLSMSIFVMLQGFFPTVQFFLFLVGFKDNVEPAFEVEPSSLHGSLFSPSLEIHSNSRTGKFSCTETSYFSKAHNSFHFQPQNL